MSEEITQALKENPQLIRQFLIETIENCSVEFLGEFFKADLGLESDIEQFLNDLSDDN